MLGELFEKITTFIFDVDGVLTDASLLVMEDGSLLRTMNAKDGYALQLAVKKGYQVLFISGGNSKAVEKRLIGLQASHIYFGVVDKVNQLQQIQKELQLNLANAIYMGDDMPDIKVMQLVGLPCAPADACPEIIEIAKYISPFGGGKGAARDVIEKVLKLKGDWE